MRRGLWAVLIGLVWAGSARAEPPLRADPLQDYRRVEIIAPRGFTATCAPHGAGQRCLLSEVPPAFSQLLAAFGDGVLASVTLQRPNGASAVVEITPVRAGLTVQTRRLEAPPRWVVQVATPRLQLGPIEDEAPRRPYPMTGDPIAIQEPTTAARWVPGPTAELSAAFRRCHTAWKANAHEKAWRLCRRIVIEDPKSTFGRAVVLTMGEIAYDTHKSPVSAPLDVVIDALKAAEDVADTPVHAVRYALLAADVLRREAFAGRADAHLDDRRLRYLETPAAPYLVMAQARSRLESGQRTQARALLESLRASKDASPMTGAAMASLAGLAYKDGDFVQALGAYDVVRERWPELLIGDPRTLIHAAETFNLYGRDREARALYTAFLERYPNTAPFWVAIARLAMLDAGRAPVRSAKALENAIIDLSVGEGQDLLFLFQARLSGSPADARRLIRALRGVSLTDHVHEAVLAEAARIALQQGRLRDALTDLIELRRVYPNATVLRTAPLLFDRLLLLLADEHARNGAWYSLVSLYYSQRRFFDADSIRGEARLVVGRGLGALAMTEEALAVLQGGVTPHVEAHQPGTAAALYLEAATLLRHARDPFRLKKMLQYLDARFPNRFDTFEYWMAKGADAVWSKQGPLARKMFNYALNGPVSAAERVELAQAIAEIHLESGATDEALAALRTVIELHDQMGGPLADLRRRDARWRIAELQIEQLQWPQAIAALSTFLEEYPDDEDRFEARFFRGRGLARLGDETGAMRQWDRLAKEDADGTFGTLAATEMKLARWRDEIAPRVESQAGLANAPTTR